MSDVKQNIQVYSTNISGLSSAVTGGYEVVKNPSEPLYKIAPPVEKATKHDSGKTDLSLNPRVALDAMAEAFQVGAKKYGRHNYYKGHSSNQLVAAALRHLTAYNEGEERDPDGQLHLGSVMACCAMILQQAKLGTLVDDRYKETK